MTTLKVVGIVDSEQRLSAVVPDSIPPGAVSILVLVPDEDLSEMAWTNGVAQAWHEDLADPRQDFYTLDDGERF